MTKLIDKDEGLWAAIGRLATDVPEFLAGPTSESPADGHEPIVLAYGPVARRNQFQAMLYGMASEMGFHLLPIQKLGLMGRIPWHGRTVCHLHWIHEQTASANSLAEADAAVESWRGLLRGIRGNGHAILWTVHNVLPHSTRWPQHDEAIHQLVADAADVVHVMTRESAALCSPHYHWDAGKELLVPHPSYRNGQADWMARAQARAELGIGASEFVFLSFGAVLAYKGYEALMQAFGQLRARSTRPVRLVVAGAPNDPGVVERLRTWAVDRDDVLLDLRIIPGDEIQVHFRAADVAVCPYERTLNSGAALMGAAFGLPVIGPLVGAFVDGIGPEAGILYARDDPQGLEQAMVSAMAEDLEPRRAAATRLSESLAPGRVSQAFFSSLRERLAGA